MEPAAPTASRLYQATSSSKQRAEENKRPLASSKHSAANLLGQVGAALKSKPQPATAAAPAVLAGTKRRFASECGPSVDADETLKSDSSPGSGAATDLPGDAAAGSSKFELSSLDFSSYRSFLGAAKRLVMDELLEKRHAAEESHVKLLCTKQAMLLYLENAINNGAGGNVTEIAKLRELESVMTQRSIESANRTAQAAAANAEKLAEKDRALAAADTLIAELRARVAAGEHALEGAQRSAQEAAAASAAAVETVHARIEEVRVKAAADVAAERESASALREQLEAAGSTEQALRAEIAAALSAAASQREEAQAQLAALNRKLSASEDKCISLHEQVLTLKGAIRVFVRVRPTLPMEAAPDSAPVAGAPKLKAGQGKAGTASAPSADDCGPLFTFPDAGDDASALEVVERPGAGVGGYGVGEAKRSRFSFQRVLPPTSSQSELFSDVEGLVLSTLNGQRVCIFAYGQTGAGKTHTMLGGAGDARGIIPRAVEAVFEQTERLATQGWVTQLTAEMVEIYNEEIRDLLALPGAAVDDAKHEIRHEKDGTTTITGVASVVVDSVASVEALLSRAAASRSTGATASNAVSSRSHSVFVLRVAMRHPATAQTRHGVLNLIDLAGSERIAKSGVNDGKTGGNEKLLKETQAINKSLAALSQTIMALQQKAAHIPFRNSKLTYLLQNSLGPKCRTLLLCNLNPLHAHAHESICTLRFASAVSEVTTATSRIASA